MITTMTAFAARFRCFRFMPFPPRNAKNESKAHLSVSRRCVCFRLSFIFLSPRGERNVRHKARERPAAGADKALKKRRFPVSGKRRHFLWSLPETAVILSRNELFGTRQVSWLQINLRRAFSPFGNGSCAFVPVTVAGTAADLHRIPFSSLPRHLEL